MRRSNLSKTTLIVTLILCLYVLGLQNQYDEEVRTRIEREKDILQELDDEKYKLEKKIDNERTDKSLKFGAFDDQIRDRIKK